jgi:hypothetical protein
MTRKFILMLCAVMAAASLEAAPVRMAPEFTWPDASGKLQTLKDFRGKPVVLLIAPSPRDRRFRSQVKWIQNGYERLAAAGTIFIAAFTEEPGRVESNVPFVIASNGPQVGYLYEVPQGSVTALIGKDGNLDYVTRKVLADQRILDIIGNSFVPQQALRRE